MLGEHLGICLLNFCLSGVPPLFDLAQLLVDRPVTGVDLVCGHQVGGGQIKLLEVQVTHTSPVEGLDSGRVPLDDWCGETDD